MSLRTQTSGEETPLGPTEMQALRRLAEPIAQRAPAEPEQLWASRYRIQEPIGKGGMGDVYLAHDIVLDRLVALKVLRKTSDESFVDEDRLLREARAAARVEHERLARVYDAGTWEGQAFIAMEYVRGETLRDWMKTYRPTASEIVTIMQQILEGLHVLHERGLVHRDLKPENIMVTADGNLRILDLGIARRVPLADNSKVEGNAPSAITLGFGVGTPGYMAPEQWRHGEIDARADLFALGVIAFELVVGRAPFCGGTNLEIREHTLHDDPSFAATEWHDVPVAIKSTIQTALARDPRRRFQSVPDMAKSLVTLFRPTLPPISGSGSHPIRPPGDDRPRPESLSASVVGMSSRAPRRRSSVLFVGAGLIVAVAAVSFFVLQRKHAQAVASYGMVRLSGGSFSMGSDRAALDAMCKSYPKGCPPEAENETPARPVSVAPFEIDEREVTNEEFVRFLNYIGPSLFIRPDPETNRPRFVHYRMRPTDDLLLVDLWEADSGIEKDPQGKYLVRAGFEKLPVTLVTWLAARLYCKNVGKRLPTEAEWEFAAKGTENRAYPWGNDLADCNNAHVSSKGHLNTKNPEYCDRNRTTPFPVMTASQDVTPDGVFDMGGNVIEWVDENADTNEEEATYVSRLTAESTAVFRGGAYNAGFMARSTSRNFRLAFNAGRNIGFRCAKTITP